MARLQKAIGVSNNFKCYGLLIGKGCQFNCLQSMAGNAHNMACRRGRANMWQVVRQKPRPWEVHLFQQWRKSDFFYNFLQVCRFRVGLHWWGVGLHWWEDKNRNLVSTTYSAKERTKHDLGSWEQSGYFRTGAGSMGPPFHRLIIGSFHKKRGHACHKAVTFWSSNGRRIRGGLEVAKLPA